MACERGLRRSSLPVSAPYPSPGARASYSVDGRCVSQYSVCGVPLHSASSRVRVALPSRSTWCFLLGAPRIWPATRCCYVLPSWPANNKCIARATRDRRSVRLTRTLCRECGCGSPALDNSRAGGDGASTADHRAAQVRRNALAGALVGCLACGKFGVRGIGSLHAFYVKVVIVFLPCVC
jgi:hypothetical protein